MTTTTKVIRLADYTVSPHWRFRNEIGYSGQQFREDVLEPSLKEAVASKAKLVVNLDGLIGCSAAFLHEAFGKLELNGLDRRVLPEFIGIETKSVARKHYAILARTYLETGPDRRRQRR